MKANRIKYAVLPLLVLAGILLYYLYPTDTKIPPGITVRKIVVLKSERKMQVYSGDGILLKTYRIALGKNPVGAKHQEGDNKTPEGHYTIYAKNPESKYHKNLGISYPNGDDRSNALKSGIATGGDVKIHGLPNGVSSIGKLQALKDWTAGCIALSNEEIDELYDHTPVGTPIEIKP